MNIFSRNRRADDRRTPMIDELERRLKLGLLLLVVLPGCALGGLRLGRVAARGLELGPGAEIRIIDAPFTEPAKLERLSRYITFVRDRGVRTEDYVRLYRDHVQPVETTLVGWGVDRTTARRTAWPLVEYSYLRGLDPATVTAIVLVESDGRPWARSNVGARGLMQIMPMHRGRWAGCGRDLHGIQDNLCYGTSIYAALLRRYNGDEARALLSYNGCVNGSNTPGCHNYPARIRSLRARIRDDWSEIAPPAASAVAAAP